MIEVAEAVRFSSPPGPVLPVERLEAMKGWGGAVGAAAYVYRPSTIAQLKEAFEVARSAGRKVTLRGAGRSWRGS